MPVPRFEPIQLVNKGTLSEKLQDVKLFSDQHPDGLLINLGNCIRVMNATVPRGMAIRIGLFNRNEGQTVEGKIEKFLYTINRNSGEVNRVYGVKLNDNREIVFTDDAYSHQASTDFESVEIMPCPAGGRRRKHKSVKRRRIHKRKTHRRRKY